MSITALKLNESPVFSVEQLLAGLIPANTSFFFLSLDDREDYQIKFAEMRFQIANCLNKLI
jgi:hypothetical protein